MLFNQMEQLILNYLHIGYCIVSIRKKISSINSKMQSIHPTNPKFKNFLIKNCLKQGITTLAFCY